MYRNPIFLQIVQDQYARRYGRPVAAPAPGLPKTDWSDVQGFIRSLGPAGPLRYERWLSRRRQDYTPAVFDPWLQRYEAFSHRALYQVRPEEVEAMALLSVSTPGEHALGQSRKTDGGPKTADVTAPPPLMFGFHTCLEKLGRIPRWTEFLAFMEANPAYYLEAFFKHVGFDATSPEYDWNRRGEMGAARYRLGNAYYAALKELHLLTCLRHRHGIDVRYHFLLDIEWKADLFSGNAMAELFISNPFYKSQISARKQRCRTINPTANVIELELMAEAKFGYCWLLPPAEVEKVASAFLSAGCLTMENKQAA